MNELQRPLTACWWVKPIKHTQPGAFCPLKLHRSALTTSTTNSTHCLIALSGWALRKGADLAAGGRHLITPHFLHFTQLAWVMCSIRRRRRWPDFHECQHYAEEPRPRIWPLCLIYDLVRANDNCGVLDYASEFPTCMWFNVQWSSVFVPNKGCIVTDDRPSITLIKDSLRAIVMFWWETCNSWSLWINAQTKWTWNN